MNIAIIGPGNIGGHLAAQFAKAGHNVIICFSKNESRLKQRAGEIGLKVSSASVARAVAQSDVIVLSVMWDNIDEVIAEAGDLSRKIVIDATNQYATSGFVALHTSVAEYNQARLPGAQLVRAFNMFTSGFQAEVARGEHQPIAMFYATESQQARATVEQLIIAIGFEPIYLGGWNAVRAIEAPDGMLVGKSYRPDAARAIAQVASRGDMVRVAELAGNG